MSLTVLDLITEGLEEITASSPGETLETADQAKALAVLIRMVEASNVNRANIASLRVDTWTLTPNVQTYTIGPAGHFTTARPINIERANLILTTGVRRKLNLLDDDQWAAKKYLAATGPPLDLYNDGNYPASTYSFYPKPDQAYQFETYTWQQFAQTTVGDVLAIPPGYYEFWLYSLAIRLCGPFGKTAPATTIELFNEARAAVQSLNCTSPRMATDGDLPGGRGGLYNWMSGSVETE